MTDSVIKPAWLLEAEKHIGQNEIPGIEQNPWIVALWKAIKRGGIKSEDVPWCSAFVGFCFEKVDIISSRYESAASWMNWGQKISGPRVGSVCVIHRKGGNHVFFPVGRLENGWIVGLGGNQSNAVNYAAFNPVMIRANRWPLAVPVPTEHLPLMADVPTSTSEA